MAELPSAAGRYALDLIVRLVRKPSGFGLALQWLAMYALARIVVVRRLIRRISPGRRRREKTSPNGSMFEMDAAVVVESLERRGVDSRLRLPSVVVRELASWAAEIPAAPYAQVERPVPPSVETIAQDPTLWEVAARYIGAETIYQGSRMWWLRPVASVRPLETGTRFHYDLYDYRAVVFLCYLTDVDPESGPHICVAGSHRMRRWKDQLRLRRHRSDEDVARDYGTEPILTLCGPAGTVIAEDPFCFHRASLPIGKSRLALQLLYTGRAFPVPSFGRSVNLPAARSR